MAKVIGIDLGTTNSCVSVMDGKAPKIIENIPFSIFVFWGSNGCRIRQIGSGSFAFLTVGKFALAVFENGRN